MSVPAKVRVRFAPSPTGHLHVGNARTALFNWLFARRHNGTFILRIEDTDLERSREDYIENILTDLRWLTLEWDEGPDIGGPFGPYRQSQRLALYQQRLERLAEKDLAYPCFCSVDDLEKKRSQSLETGAAPKYDGACRALVRADWEKRIAAGEKPSWRFRMPEKTIVVDDLIRGEVSFDTSLFGDFIIMRPNGVPSFHFAVAVDDICMQITHVIRGEDHLTNTPRHIALFEALGAPLPRFAHMSMVMGPGKTKLSKRHGAVSIDQYRELGYLPEGLGNYIALLGWAPPQEIMRLEEMAPHFDIARLGKAASIFDIDKLNWVSGQHIRSADVAKLTTLAIPYFKEQNLIVEDISEDRFLWLQRIVGALRGHVSSLSELPAHARVFFTAGVDYAALGPGAAAVLAEPGMKDLLLLCADYFDPSRPVESYNLGDLNKLAKEKTGLSGKKFYMGLRVALTGQEHGPELPEVLSILGAHAVVERLRRAAEFLSAPPAAPGV